MEKSSLESDLSRIVLETSRANMALIMSRLAEQGYDVNPSFAQVMPWIDKEGVRLTTLAQRVGVTKQAIGQLVQQLVAVDFVEQMKDPTDGRAKMIRLTPRGMAACKVCLAAKEELNKAAAAVLGEEALAKLNSDLLKVLAQLQSRQQP